MSIRKNTWNLNSKYDLTNSGWDDYFIGLESPAELFAVGDNDSYGGLGQNDIITRSSPVQIPGTEWIGLASGRSSDKLAWKNDNTLWGWGKNNYGQLGLNTSGTNSAYSSPVQIPGTQWKHTVYAIGGEDIKASVKTDGTLWTWGSNYRGQLGVNDAVDRSSPVQIPGTEWSKAFAGADKCAGIKTDGTLWVWGRNNYGGLGVNFTNDRSSPIQIPGTEWKQVSSSFYWMMGTKTDGTLWAWGRDQGGCLAQNNTIQRSSPTQIPGTEWVVGQTDIYNATSGAGVKTDGTLWAWGYNTSGMLGQNDNVPTYSSPRQIPGTQWSTRISVGQDGMTCTKTDGTLWAWGENLDGQLGQTEPNTGYSSPVQIPGTDWQMSIIDIYNLLALKN